MSFIIRWGLEDKGIEHLLRLIDCHMPVPLLGSKYLFLKKFPTPPSMKIRYICPECSDLLPRDIDEGIECSCGHYCSIKILKDDGNFFVQLSISDQIQQIMSNNELVNLMRKECQENDVINGKVYRRLRNRGVIGDDDVTLQWNTDGVRPFKSSNVSVWPIQACINELPFNARKDNMLLCGLYYGKEKPIINAFMKPFVDELENLHTEGIVCNVSGKGYPVNIKVHTLLSSVDSVARPKLQGIKQFNGKYGCSFCLHTGRRIERGRGSARVYIGSLGELRSTEQHLQALEQLEYYNDTHRQKKTHIQGVKGGSVLLLLSVFNIIWSFVPDYMHASLEGVVTTFLKHWTSYENKDKDYYLNSNKRKILNDRIQSIKPPVEITRTPRKIDELNLWKASELRSFLLYYSLVCLKGLIPHKYLKHWFLFVYSMTIFLKEKFDDYKFENAKAALVKFVDNIAVVYSGCYSLYTFNIHLLFHMPKAAEDFGGLWASSTFPFEHFNGVLTKLIKGTRSVPQQICRSFLRLRHVSHLSSKIFSCNDCSQPGKELYESMLWKYYSSHNSYLFSNTLRLFGAPENYSLPLVEKITIQEYLQINVKSIAQSFRRLIFKGIVFHANAYGALTVRNNSIAQMNDGIFIDIARILIIDCVDPERKHCVVLGELLEVSDEDLCHDRELGISSNNIVHICRRSGRIISYLTQSIISKCVCVSYSNAVHIIPLVNTLERD